MTHARRRWHTSGAGGADTWQEATRVHANAREGRYVARGLASEGPMGDVATSQTSDASVGRRSRGLESTQSSSRHVRKEIISEALDGRHVASLKLLRGGGELVPF